MKEIRIFIRAKELDYGVYRGVIGMQYKKVVKNDIVNSIEEDSKQRAELILVDEAINRIKEPCKVTVYTTDRLVVQYDEELVTLHGDDLVDKIQESINQGNHVVQFVKHTDKDNDKIKQLFEDYEKILSE